MLKGDGDLKGSSVGSKDLEFTFIENKEENIYFTDSVLFSPSEDNESWPKPSFLADFALYIIGKRS